MKIKETERAQKTAQVQSTGRIRKELNWWLKSYQFWRNELSKANRLKSPVMKSNSMRGINRTRALTNHFAAALSLKLYGEVV